MLTFPAKSLRAEVVGEYVRAAGFGGVVCFSCGNAAQALREVGLDVLEIGPKGSLQANEWWTPAEIRRIWPDRFDATSGHLPTHLMLAVGRRFREHLGDIGGGPHKVATGSGETILCLRWAYPVAMFVPCYGCEPGAEYDARAPLNTLVTDAPPVS